MTDLTLNKVLNIYRSDFAAFATKAFNILNPGTTFIPTPAFAAMTYALSKVESGQTRRLIINVPPRSGKSLLASIALPAFVLGRDPTRRIVCASYAEGLAGKLARDCRTLIAHPSYRQLFPATVITGKNTEFELETAHGGFRFATTVGGTLLGRGGNLIVIDDPMKTEDAMSRTARDRAWEWFTGTVGSRLDNKAEGAIAVIAQRLHVDDLCGRLIERGGWDILSLPAIAEDEQRLLIGNGRVHVRKPGDILDPTREPREVLEQAKRDLGSTNFEAQYQQQPVPEDGGLFDWAWFQTFAVAPRPTAGDILVISWDTAMKDKEVNDYSVGIVALIKPNRWIYILDVIRVRLNFASLRTRIIDEAQKWPNAMTLIEDAGSGTILLSDLRGKIRLFGPRPMGDKVMRFQPTTIRIQAGEVHLPARASWLEAFKRELLSFPKSAHDDQVDAFSQLLSWDAARPRNTSYVGRQRYV
jgi:predicted phage terminase large subunit-like protein